MFLISVASQLSGFLLPTDVEFPFPRARKSAAYTTTIMIIAIANNVIRAAMNLKLLSINICLLHHPALRTASCT